MTPQERQQALDNLTAEELAKVAQKQVSEIDVDPEWMALVEFARVFGWDAYLAVKRDELTMEEMATLLQASRKLDYLRQVEMSQAVFIAIASANSKNPATTFKKLIQGIINRAKVHE